MNVTRVNSINSYYNFLNNRAVPARGESQHYRASTNSHRFDTDIITLSAEAIDFLQSERTTITSL